MENNYYQDEEYKKCNPIFLLKKRKTKNESILDKIPEKYKGNDYVIHKLNCNKKKK